MENEFRQALRYIDRNLKLYDNWPGKDASDHERAKREFKRLRFAHDLDGLEDWCGRWLNDARRRKLLTALRARKKRGGSGAGKKTVSLDPRAWLYLSELAKRDKVTLSEFLIRRLEGDCEDMSGRKEGAK